MKKEGEVFRLRFYRLDRGYHVVSLPIHATVAHVTPALISRLTGNSEAHRLYLQERGKERILASTDKPAGIVRRRMEQAGYDLADGLDLLADDGLNFLLRFVWKTQLLGGVDEERDFKLDSFEFIDLTARGLRTIPVSLHKNSESIVFLKLNRNPMLDIPLDFIQSCTQLREIRLSHMAMKKVPLSLRYCLTLHYLDLSCNRIADLDEAYLDNIPDLRSLTIQNNRIEKLPWHFSRLRALLTLNISNNKFKEMPPVITQLEALRDLDISFNMISELPEDLDHLRSLERFILVSNQIVRFPDCASNLLNLKELDCRRNLDWRFEHEYNNVASLDMSIGPKLAKLDASHNDLTKLTLTPGPTQSLTPYALTLLDISHAKLASLDDFALARLSGLEVLKLSHNMFTSIPETVGDLVHLEQLECSDNHLLTLPSSIGRLQRLERLDAHNNSIPEVPITLWQCPALRVVNLTSNMLEKWLDPPLAAASTTAASVVASSSASAVMALSDGSLASERKASASSLGTTHASSRTTLPPLAHSLERLYLGENNLTEDGLLTLTLTRELRVLNLSFNDLQELPTGLFRHLTNLEELYMSGNKLTNLQPADDLPKMHRLSTLFLNGNRLQNLPQELGQVPNLVVLDVGSNMLKYNINNTEWDWNWNFNKSLKYLNLSGNDRLQIKPPASRSTYRQSRDLSHMVGFNSKASSNLSGFSALSQLRVLGLMDVMIATGGLNRGVDIPEETDERRVRTSMSVINGMSYGIADTLGKNQQLNMLDLVYEYRDRPGQAVFAMFGRALPPKHVPPGASTNKLAKFLHDNFIDTFNGQLDAVRHNPGISRANQTPDALRRTFLKLNQDLHGYLYNSTRKGSAASAAAPVDPTVARSGASGVVLYFMGAQLWVANAGNALAVISRRGIAEALTRHHVPYDRQETERIRAAEGWISPPGLINDELDISRSFGFYHLLPVVNSRPDIRMRDLTDSDEFIIVGNRGLWDYVSYQTAVDIARQELDLPTEGGRMRRADLAAQKLRDFALSYGAEGSTMIMVISVADLFSANTHRNRQATIDSVDSPIPSVPRVKKPRINRELDRLRDEVDPPTGHVTLAFTDIRNSTPLWEANPGMPAAMKIHNTVLRRYLRICGGYEVKTEGDAFMCAFPNTLSALWWCLICQLKLLEEPWPLEILECDDGKEVFDAKGQLIARGLSVRMGIHCGEPLCERDPNTKRMDYFGPMVNRAARIEANARGGQIACSTDIVREVMAKIHETGPLTPYSEFQPEQAIKAIKAMGAEVIEVGEVKLKGLEATELLSIVYPTSLKGRHFLEERPSDAAASASSRIQFSVSQMQDVGLLCLRLENLAAGRVFRVRNDRKDSTAGLPEEEGEDEEQSNVWFGDPAALLPPISEQSSDDSLMQLLDQFSERYAPGPAVPLEEETEKFLFSLVQRGMGASAVNDILEVLQGMKMGNRGGHILDAASE
ncbi:adenylate cyclase [Flagelloscypha sp. PMI_526]|nr:adenylate cyclase [Flagelloscypha sp. PMI_526]